MSQRILNGDMLEAIANGHTDFTQSFDARVWAREFVHWVRLDPSIATDEEAMTGWFANALMRGYDELRPASEMSSEPVVRCTPDYHQWLTRRHDSDPKASQPCVCGKRIWNSFLRYLLTGDNPGPRPMETRNERRRETLRTLCTIRGDDVAAAR